MKVAILDCNQLRDKLDIGMDDVTYVSGNFDLSGYDILINPLGRYIDENIVEQIIEFYNKGGIIINLSSYAYTTPYYIDNGKIKIQNNTVDIIRSFGMIDSYIPCENGYLEGKAQCINDKYKYLEKYFNGIKRYNDVCFLEHNLARSSINEENDDINGLFVHNRQESIINLTDDNDNVLCSLISKTMEIGQGVIYNFNFDTSNLNLREIVTELVKKEFEANAYIYAEPELSRYYEDEEINILAKVYSKQYADAKILLQVVDDFNNVQYKEYFNVVYNEVMIFTIPNLKEGLYKVTLRLINNDVTLDIKDTGVLVVSDKTILEACKKYDRLIVDKNISTEFHTRNGEVVPIHGTTYFVSDVMRRCFVHMNPYLCKKEVQNIAKLGYNVIRSGLWHNMLNSYGDDGKFTKRTIRAMQTMFYVALKNNITVQFALGHGELNNWDLKSSVVHNPIIRKKSMNLVCNFFKLFKDYTNVQMDIVNEPSYSRNGAWGIGRPSDDENELENYRRWLQNKYDNDIEKLCDNWGVSKYKIKDFSHITLPKDGYYRLYNRTEQTINHAKLSDFFDFARESFSGWCSDIRNYGRKIAPNMIVLMGRDESIRIPCEQDEYLACNIDTINWHQWNQNSIVFTEYLLSKVPNSICCGQEHGVYKLERHRGEKALKDVEVSNLLERKLLYSLGNFVEWQLNNDPYMSELSENNIGIIRNDGSKMPVVDRITKLMEKEDKMAIYEKGEELSNTKIFVIHPTSYHFSVDNKLSEQAVRTSLNTLVYDLKQHIYVILEHTLKFYYDLLKDGGNLLILPSACILKDETWEYIKKLTKLGNNILITGAIERDNYYIQKDRIREIDSKMKLKPIRVIEKTKIGKPIQNISFKKCVSYNYAPNILEKCCSDKMDIQTIIELNMGLGKIYYFPLPVELADQEEIVTQLYQYVISVTNTQSQIFEMYNSKVHKNIFIYPKKFKECTVYTIINEGETDIVRFKDLTSNKEFEFKVSAERGIKIWIDNNGKVLETYNLV